MPFSFAQPHLRAVPSDLGDKPTRLSVHCLKDSDSRAKERLRSFDCRQLPNKNEQPSVAFHQDPECKRRVANAASARYSDPTSPGDFRYPFLVWSSWSEVHIVALDGNTAGGQQSGELLPKVAVTK